MTNNEIEDERNICLKTVKNEQKYCNNNDERKWKPSDLDENKKVVSEVVRSAEVNNTKNDNITSDNSENDDLKENESILKDMKGKYLNHKRIFIK